MCAHPLHLAATLVLGHRQRPVNRLGGLLDGERVDQQGVAQFPSRSREAAEDQDAVVVAGDVFLGHEIHPIVERADDAESREAVQRHHVRRPLVALDVSDRLPAPRPPAGVNLLDHLINLAIDLLIRRHVRPARDRDLDEAQPAAVFGMILEQEIEPPDPVGDSLGVVQPLDAHADLLITQVQLAPPASHCRLDLTTAGLEVMSLEINANRERPDQGAMSATMNLVPVDVDACFDPPIDRVEEVLAVVMHVEAK